MTETPFDYAVYNYKNSEERILRIGGKGENILFLPALFVENNRLRALTVAVMRRLAAKEYRCILPDLPGTLESRAKLEDQAFSDWEKALLAACTMGKFHVAAIRGGCLLGGALKSVSRWHFAPVTGEKLMREMFRVRQAALRESGQSATLAEIEAECAVRTTALAGERLSPALSTTLKALQPHPARTLRLESDPAEADRHIDGPALWRRSEPEIDDVLAAVLADDLADWINACDAG